MVGFKIEEWVSSDPTSFFFLFFFLIGLLAAGCDGFMMYGFGLWTATCGKYWLNGFNRLWPDSMGLKGLSVGLAECGFGLLLHILAWSQKTKWAIYVDEVT